LNWVAAHKCVFSV